MLGSFYQMTQVTSHKTTVRANNSCKLCAFTWVLLIPVNVMLVTCDPDMFFGNPLAMWNLFCNNGHHLSFLNELGHRLSYQPLKPFLFLVWIKLVKWKIVMITFGIRVKERASCFFYHSLLTCWTVSVNLHVILSSAHVLQNMNSLEVTLLHCIKP